METSIEAELDLWLGRKGRQLEPLFPPELERFYDAETRGQKINDRKIATIIAIATCVLLTPLLWTLVPETHWMERWIWCGVSFPVATLSYVVLLTDLPLFWQEVQTIAGSVVVALTYCFVMLAGGRSLLPIYLGGFVLLVMLNIIASSFRFRLAIVYTVAITAIFDASIQTIPSLQHAVMLDCCGLMVSVSICAVFGAWRVETEQRRTFALMLRDRRKQEALSQRNSELDQLTLRDALTGSANRRAYEAWKIDTWSAAAQWGLPVALVLVDIDNFKLYNDTFGHACGDVCIRQVACCMVDQLRGTTDMVARIGGEEFAVILPGATMEAAGAVAERVRHAVEMLRVPHAAGAAHPFVTVSCGGASLAAGPLCTPEQLFAAADAALYAAKRGGRNRLCLAGCELPGNGHAYGGTAADGEFRASETSRAA